MKVKKDNNVKNKVNKGFPTILADKTLECLKYIREQNGKVYAYELMEGIDVKEELDSVLKQICILEDMGYVKTDKASLKNMPRLTALVTNPDYRVELDKLLKIKGDTTYSKSIESIEHLEKDKVTVKYLFKKNKAEDKPHKDIEYQFITMDSLIETVKEKRALDFSQKGGSSRVCIKDFNYKILEDAVAGSDYNILAGFNAQGVLFCGDINFDKANFVDDASFKNAVFSSEYVSFKEAKFRGNITFRNARFFCQQIDFSGAKIGDGYGESSISFEDAVFDTAEIYFDKMNFGKSELYCFQTLFNSSKLSFAEAIIGNAEICFDDCELNSIVFLNINKLPEMNMQFRQADIVLIINCNITSIIYLDNIRKISFRGTKNNGSIITKWNIDKSRTISEAIRENGNTCEEITEQFVMLKENFKKLGEYESEDKAFVEYMKMKKKKSVTKSFPSRVVFRILNVTGNFGTSPLKVVISMIFAIIFFGIIFSAFSYLNLLDSKIQIFNDSAIINSLANGFYFSFANFLSANSQIMPTHYLAILFTFAEIFIGWFLLVYLSISIIRKAFPR